VFGKSAIIDFFLRHNISNIFYLPGIHTLSLSDILKVKNINVFVPRHEASMAFMADGFARASGNIGVLIVTPGPGLGNIVSGCMEAYGDDIPLLIIHIDTGRKDIGKGILHELVEPENMFRYFTKKRLSVHGKEDLVHKLEEAHHAALDERKGPVLISIPYTLLEKEISPYDLDNVESIPPVPPHDFSELDSILANKNKPVIIGGRSLMFAQARPLLDKICANSSIPFVTTTSGKGILDEDNPWCFGNIMQKGVVKEIISSADITIAIGTRLRDADAKRRGVKIRDLIHFDIDDFWINKNYPTSYNGSGNILAFLCYLDNITNGKTFEWPLEKMKQKQHLERQHLYKKNLGFQLARLLEESTPKNTSTVWDLNLIAYWAEYYFSVHHQRSFIMPRGISPIFYSLPAAIGAKLGRPEMSCLAICGDGSILPTISELSTIRKYNIPVVILVFNNKSFGVLEDYMRTTYSLKGTMDLENPDFMKIASAFGIKGKRVKTIQKLKKTLQETVRWDEPFLLEYCGPVFAPPWRV
jgi:acetolactate synthase-1/2/3 large subunit